MNKKNYAHLVVAAILLQFSFNHVVQAQTLPAGTLDTTFSTDGMVLTPVTVGANEGRAVAVQTDGKIVVAGNAKNGALDNFGLVRYNTDGTLDNSFGTAGKITTSCGPGNNVARAIAIQTDGKIVVAGNQENQTYSQFAVARYNTNGVLDNTFGTGGKAVTHLDYGFDLAYAVAIQADGKIVAGGVSFDTLANGEFGIVRYNANGTLDNTFGVGGKIRTPLGTQWDQAQSIVIQNDGKIILGGRTATQMAMVRYNTNGTLDASFGLGGIVALQVGPNSDVINSLKLKPDGRIIAGGVTQNGTDYNFIIVQFDQAGNVDGNFGIGGILFADFGGTDILFALNTDANENIIAAGSSGAPTAPEFTVSRYDSVGNYDYTFGPLSSGFVTTNFGGGSAAGANGVAVQPDGRIVATGSALNGALRNFATARYFHEPVFVGINEIDANAALILNPNPSTDHFILSSKKMMEGIEVSDIMGKIIYTYSIPVSTAKIDTRNWADGVYLVKVKADNALVTKKLIVKH